MSIEKQTNSRSKVDLSLVLPVLNEQENIFPLYEEIIAVFNQMNLEYEIIFVDDGSTDQSISLLKELAARDPNVRVLIFSRNFGQTAAMSAGIDNARGEVIMLMDADRQNDPADIPLLYRTIQDGHDVVVGWRKDRKDRALNRKLPSRVANWIIRKVGDVDVKDLGCSHKAFRREFIQNVRLYGEMHRFIPLYTNAMGGRLKEVAVNHRARVAGETKYGIARTYKVLLDLFTVKFLMKYLTRPMYFFGGFGFLFSLLSVTTASAALFHKLYYDVSIIRSPLLIVTAVFVIISVNFFLMGLMAELLMRTYFESQNKKSYYFRETLNV